MSNTYTDPSGSINPAVVPLVAAVAAAGPKPFLLAHHREHLHQSGLKDPTIEAAQIYSIDDAAQAAHILNRKGAWAAPGIAFPVFDQTGQVSMIILRIDLPLARDDGSKPKYESPLGVAPRLYFPPPQLVAPQVWLDTSIPLVFTEGIKKALAASQTGCKVPCISAQGITVWHDIEHKKKTGEYKLHPDLAGVPLKGRIVYIAFDGGDTTTNPNVILAEAQLARMLLDVGAIPRLVRIPALDQKVGLDDFLAANVDTAAQALAQILEQALEADPLARVRALEEADDKPQAAAALMKDRSFVASISILSLVERDLVHADLKKKANISKVAFAKAVEEFESWRSARSLKKAEKVTDPAIAAEADLLLADPNLLQRFWGDLGMAGVVGEWWNALALLLCLVSRKMTKPLHVVLKAASSSGKSFLVKRVTELLPEEDLIEVTDMSPKALQYLPDELTGKVVVIAEQEGGERAEYPIRVAMSEGDLSILTVQIVETENGKKPVTQKHEVKGPAAFITTTTRPMLHEENETRVLELVLDDSSQQTAAIIHAMASAAFYGPAPEGVLDRKRAVWRAALGSLEAPGVWIGQALALANQFPTKRVRARRDFQKLLALIEAITLLHQHQRQRTADGRLIALDWDVATARHLAAGLAGDVPPRLATIDAKLRAVFGCNKFKPSEAAKELGCSTDAMRRDLNALENVGLASPETASSGPKAAQWRMVVETTAGNVLPFPGPSAVTKPA